MGFNSEEWPTAIDLYYSLKMNNEINFLNYTYYKNILIIQAYAVENQLISIYVDINRYYNTQNDKRTIYY